MIIILIASCLAVLCCVDLFCAVLCRVEPCRVVVCRVISHSVLRYSVVADLLCVVFSCVALLFQGILLSHGVFAKLLTRQIHWRFTRSGLATTSRMIRQRTRERTAKQNCFSSSSLAKGKSAGSRVGTIKTSSVSFAGTPPISPPKEECSRHCYLRSPSPWARGWEHLRSFSG